MGDADSEPLEADTLTEISLPGVPLLSAKGMGPAVEDPSASGPALSESVSALCDPKAHRALAERFEGRGNPDRARVLREMAEAIEGTKKDAPPPRIFLDADGRRELRHPSVRKEAAELLSLCGEPLVSLFAEDSVPQGTPLDAAVGPGSERSIQALCRASRVLGMPAPLPQVASAAAKANRPPFFINGTRPRFWVSDVAVEKVLSEGELRFFAGRALFSMCPDLLALRLLDRSELKQGLALLKETLFQSRSKDPRAHALRGQLSEEAVERLRELFPHLEKQMSLGDLSDGARYTVNRAGLLVAGGIGPAVSALRHKHAGKDELEELMAFAGSDAYAALRNKA